MSLRQRRRRAISQWIGVILYGFSDSVRSGRSRSVQRSVELPMKENMLCVKRHNRCQCFTASSVHFNWKLQWFFQFCRNIYRGMYFTTNLCCLSGLCFCQGSTLAALSVLSMFNVSLLVLCLSTWLCLCLCWPCASFVLPPCFQLPCPLV